MFLELWLETLSLELWLEIEGIHVAFLELWLGMAEDFGSLGTLRAMFVLGTPPGVTVCDP